MCIRDSQGADSLGEVAPRIQAIVANGETRVSTEFLSKFPSARILAVWGVGYDGVDAVSYTHLDVYKRQLQRDGADHAEHAEHDPDCPVQL